MDNIKILVVEDEKDIRELLTKHFAKNYCALSAATVAEAVQVVKKEHPDIALLDIHLGSESGLDVLKEIKEFDKNIKVIMVTVVCDEKVIQQAVSLGADEYVAKPVPMDYLNNLVKDKAFESKLHKEFKEISKKYLP